MTAPRCVLTLVVLLATLAHPLPADIYRWDNGQVIPGTEGITPGPGVQLDHRALEYAGLVKLDLTGVELRIIESPPTRICLSSTLTRTNLTEANLTGARSVFLDADQCQPDGGQSHRRVAGFLNADRCQPEWGGGHGANLSDTTSRGFTQAQLASTASYQAKNLQGIGLRVNDLTSWDFSDQNLTSASLSVARR